MIVSERDLEFNFSNSIDVMKFDDQAHGLSHCMKAVDFIVELPQAYLFVEVKDPFQPGSIVAARTEFTNKAISGKLQEQLVKKYRDTFIYRWAENKLDKPIHFLSLVTLEDALLLALQDELRKQLPLNGTSRWFRQIATSCLVVNVDSWNRNYPDWPVRRLSATP